jgi:mRNA interferase MazF
LVVPATRTVRGIRTEVTLDEADGMPARCVLTFDNLTTVPKTVLSERITRLSLGRLIEVCAALRIATGC